MAREPFFTGVHRGHFAGHVDFLGLCRASDIRAANAPGDMRLGRSTVTISLSG
jgi:hypothetical protein